MAVWGDLPGETFGNNMNLVQVTHITQTQGQS